MKSPTDIARAALKTAPKTEETLPPQQAQAIQKSNQVLDFLKRRRDVTPSQIQSNLGIPGTDVKGILGDLQKRGLISSARGKINYNKLPGEEIAPEQPTPEAKPAEPAEEAKVSPERQTKINNLQQMIGQAEDEGDDIQADVFREHLKAEERNAKIEQTGPPEQKAQVQELDQVYNRINELEDKEEKGGLSPEENQQLGQAYKRVSSLEKVLSDFWSEEKGESFPEGKSKRSVFSQLIFRARAGLERPGQARDTNPWAAKVGSANRVLRESGVPGATEIGEKTPQVEDLKHKFIGTYERRAASIIKGLSKDQRVEAGQILEGKASRGSPQAVKAAMDIRDMYDDIYDQHLANRGVGRVDDYLTHIKKEMGNTSFGDLWSERVGLSYSSFNCAQKLI